MSDENHEHNRFLSAKEGLMHFGCINPFCGHGSPALPNHWEIPMETKAIKIKDVSHDNRMLTFEVYLKVDVGEHKAGDIIQLISDDNLDACVNTFGNFFAGKGGKKIE